LLHILKIQRRNR